ncbi:MAG: cmk, partial [Acidimicrobiaceae bacterium]|nr:cmk [Acidimicrobiaceae bacterium]
MSFVAIDGPGGAGKSTVARALAARLGWERLDTGAMYRALTLAALRAGIDLADGEALAERARSMELVVDESVLLDGEDVSAAIRTPEVSAAVSEVSAHLAVRAELVSRQRAWASQRSAGVMEGRDIGSVVLPDALLKVYLTADPEVRAARRGAEHGPDERGVHRAAAALAARDRHDSNRGASPLTVAEGAMVVDSSGLQPEDVVDHLLAALAERGVTIDQAARTYAVPSPELVETESAEREPAARTGGEPAEVVAPPAGESRLPRGRAQGVASEPPAVRPISSGELAFYAVCRFISVGASRIYLPGPVIGAERLPKDAPFILAPTHRSYVDWLVAARVSKRRLRYLVKGEVWKSSFTGRLLELLGAFPVHRGTADRVAF